MSDRTMTKNEVVEEIGLLITHNVGFYFYHNFRIHHSDHADLTEIIRSASKVFAQAIVDGCSEATIREIRGGGVPSFKRFVKEIPQGVHDTEDVIGRQVRVKLAEKLKAEAQGHWLPLTDIAIERIVLILYHASTSNDTILMWADDDVWQKSKLRDVMREAITPFVKELQA